MTNLKKLSYVESLFKKKFISILPCEKGDIIFLTNNNPTNVITLFFDSIQGKFNAIRIKFQNSCLHIICLASFLCQFFFFFFWWKPHMTFFVYLDVCGTPKNFIIWLQFCCSCKSKDLLLFSRRFSEISHSPARLYI